jgi:signal transduction histidine kinase
VDLAAVVRGLEARWRGPLADLGRPLRMVVASASPVARASRPVLEEILSVLLENATLHGAGAVTLTVRDAAGWVAIDVADEGPGLPGDPAEAFERRSGAVAGHGIGLALARSLAHAEGARLAVGRAGPGPVFTLTLPPALIRHSSAPGKVGAP